MISIRICKGKQSIGLDQSGRISFMALILIVALGMLIPVAIVGWQEVYHGFLERNDPVIEITESPRGIGQAPVRLVISFSDADSGLDEIVVRAIQKGQTRELDRQKLGGLKERSVTLHLPGRESGFEEGEVQFQVRAFDRSLWSNRSEKELTYTVDYRAPILEVLSQQHNAKVGGSQLLVYRAVDQSLTLSGVKVGKDVFIGFPARLLDADFQDADLFAVIYAVSLDYAGGKKVPVRAFAEDRVGNAISTEFYSKEAPRKIRARRAELSSACLRSRVHPLAEQSLGVLTEYLGEEISFNTAIGSTQRHLEEFKLLNEDLRPINESQIKKLTKGTRFRRYWQQSFLKQGGTVRYGMAERLAFFGGGKVFSDLVHEGYFYRERSPAQEVIAANAGVVAFQGDFGVFGSVVGIDHGLGVFSWYGNLGKSLVSKGETVEIDDVIGRMGKTGLACESGVLFQLRVQGIPVEPAEWLSDSWYNAHIDSKIRRVKRKLGITTASSF